MAVSVADSHRSGSHTSSNKWASGSARLRRPPTQPATSRVTRWAEVKERRKQVLETKVMGAGSEALNVKRSAGIAPAQQLFGENQMGLFGEGADNG